MCGIVGIAGVMPVNQSIYDALTVLQLAAPAPLKRSRFTLTPRMALRLPTTAI